MPAKANSGRSSLSANHTTFFFLVSGFGSGAYSAKLLAGTKQRFSGLSHMRQCGEDVLRMLVTGGPPVLGGGGMPQRIVTISVPASWRGVVREHARHWRQVADVAVDDAKESDNRGLVSSDAVKIAHFQSFVPVHLDVGHHSWRRSASAHRSRASE